MYLLQAAHKVQQLALMQRPHISAFKLKAGVKPAFSLKNVTVVVYRTGKHRGQTCRQQHTGNPPKEEQTTTKALCTPLNSHLASFLQREKLIVAFFLHTNRWFRLVNNEQSQVFVMFSVLIFLSLRHTTQQIKERSGGALDRKLKPCQICSKLNMNCDLKSF